MITSHTLYTKIYKPLGIGLMIGFCWVFSFLMQLPTLLGLWGKQVNLQVLLAGRNV